MEHQFKIKQPLDLLPDQLTSKWQAPSNIALIKYWGKHGEQLPANPSLSLTLENCKTITTVTATRQPHGFNVTYDGQPKPEFAPKIQTFIDRILTYSPWIAHYHFDIDTHNTFPHSSGIASSASSMAALAACLMDIESMLTHTAIDYNKTSFIARLGSGSACRSINGSAVVWGNHDQIASSTPLYGVDCSEMLHPVFTDYQDTILLVDKGTKQVSSSVGHDLMIGHAFAKARFQQAHNHLTALKVALTQGNIEQFISITESEALSLHAMMMTSNPYFILMKPNTLSIIEQIWQYRKSTGIPVCFTLDAGANVHMLYPNKYMDELQVMIKQKLMPYCQNGQYICDQLGKGAKKC